MTDDEMPVSTVYKGVGVHAGQPARRVALVKREIDKVAKISDPARLYEIAGDCAWSPESRLLAGARCTASLQRATERREPKPDIDPERVAACTAGLSTLRWQDPFRYCSLFDSRHHERAALRDEPLDEE